MAILQLPRTFTADCKSLATRQVDSGITTYESHYLYRLSMPFLLVQAQYINCGFPLFSLLVVRLLQSSVHNNNASHDILATFPCSFLIGSLSTRPSHMEGSGSETSTWVGRLGLRLVTFVPTHQRG